MRIPLFLFILSLPLIAQQNGHFELSRKPWNGDWLADNVDQMVFGETYRGFPGPLPKILSAIGLDPAHPAVDFELQYGVDRDAPYWFGKCDSWAAVATVMDEPTTLVVNGIKLFPAELKALLTTAYSEVAFNWVFKDRGQGIPPSLLDDILASYIAANRPIIFEVDLTDEIWNYPVVSYSRSSYEDGDWTHVTLEVGYVSTRVMSDLIGEPLVYSKEYRFRYLTASQSQHEWLGGSAADHPDSAWTPQAPIQLGEWSPDTNRHVNLATYDQLLAAAALPNANWDAYEPNDAMSDASPLANNLVLASLHPGDMDLYRFHAAKDEPVAFALRVYDGPRVNMVIQNSSGQVLDFAANTTEHELTFIPLQTNDYYLILEAENGGESTSFYQLVPPYEAGYLSVTAPLLGAEQHLRAINLADDAMNLYHDVADAIPYHGSLLIDSPTPGTTYRSDGDTCWAVTHDQGAYQDKAYHRDHPVNTEYVVPHITFRNGWDTRLDLAVTPADTNLSGQVYDRFGRALETLTLPLDELGRFQGSLREQMSEQTRSQAAWFELLPHRARISGVVIFARSSVGDQVRIPLAGKPVHSEMMLFDLCSPSKGWSGLALVNASDLVNELLYRVKNADGEIISSGTIDLQPGEKLLSTVEQLAGPVMEHNWLHLSSQFPVEALIIQHRFSPADSYGHRLLSRLDDTFVETTMSVSTDPDKTELMLANPNPGAFYVLLEGYGADGTRHGRFHTILGVPLAPGEVRKSTVAEIFENGVQIVDLEAITHFRILADAPMLGMEILGTPGPQGRTTSPLTPLYDKP